MKTSDYFAEKIEIRSATKWKRVVVMLHEGAKLYVQEKVDNWKSTVNRRTEGWIESNAIREVK
jgi:hypothetical protein